MLCELGNKLKDLAAEASTRFSDFASIEMKQLPAIDRLKAEKLHVEQQEALGAFTRHVESCSVCGQKGAAKIVD